MGLDTRIDAQPLIDTTHVISAAIENAFAKRVDLELFIAVPPEAFGPTHNVKLHLLPSLDGTNYEDGSPTVDPMGLNEVFTFKTRDDEQTAHRLVALNIKVPSCNYKWLLKANFNYTVTVTLKELSQHRTFRRSTS